MSAIGVHSDVPANGGAVRWFDAIVGVMFRLIHNVEQNNFDAERYGREVHPNAFFPDKHAAYFSFLLGNRDAFFRARSLLDDRASRDLYDQLILFRLLGHLHVRLPFNNEETSTFNAIADGWHVEETADSSAFGNLSIFEVPTKKESIRLKCWRGNITATFLSRQYCFTRAGTSIEPRVGDYIIDAGGCFGDTALAFASTVGPSGHIYTFDPIPKHCSIIRENLAMNSSLAERISIHEIGLSATIRAGSALGANGSTINPGATAFDQAIPTTTIDAMIADGSVARVDFIKMDVEGSEMDALKGAEKSLREYRPRLAISLYHRPEDLFAIPLWIDQLGCGYRFGLDHYSIHHEETVLYAGV